MRKKRKVASHEPRSRGRQSAHSHKSQRQLTSAATDPGDIRGAPELRSQLRPERREDSFQQLGAEPAVLPFFVRDQLRAGLVLLKSPRLFRGKFRRVNVQVRLVVEPE